MATHKLHLHSMIVHVSAALAPLAAIAFIFFSLRLYFLSFGQNTWKYLTCFSLFVMFLAAMPSVLTGLFERNRIYGKWHSTHKIKLVLSILLLLMLAIELLILYQQEYVRRYPVRFQPALLAVHKSCRFASAAVNQP